MKKLILTSFIVNLCLCLFANSSIVFPSEVLDLSNWKVTLPIDTNTNGSPDEIKQPLLNTYSHTEYFHLNNNSDGVVFKAHAGGVTTNNSGYPRCELREMTDNGANMASWSSNDGLYHIMEVEEKITHLPDVKKHVVVAQIHDASDDIFMLRLETTKLFLEFNGTDGPTLDANYKLGTTFTFKVEVHNNEMKFYYNNILMYTTTKTFSGAYFKAGMYTQSSCQGSKKVSGESCDAYGEVELLGLSAYHGVSLPTSVAHQHRSKFCNVRITEHNIYVENCNFYGYGDIIIYDMHGQKIITENVEYQKEATTIKLEDKLKKGTYVVVLSANDEMRSLKVVVQ